MIYFFSQSRLWTSGTPPSLVWWRISVKQWSTPRSCWTYWSSVRTRSRPGSRSVSTPRCPAGSLPSSSTHPRSWEGSACCPWGTSSSHSLISGMCSFLIYAELSGRTYDFWYYLALRIQTTASKLLDYNIRAILHAHFIIKKRLWWSLKTPISIILPLILPKNKIPGDLTRVFPMVRVLCNSTQVSFLTWGKF